MGGFPCYELKALVAPRQCGLTPGEWGLRRGGGEGGWGEGEGGRRNKLDKSCFAVMASLICAGDYMQMRRKFVVFVFRPNVFLSFLQL
jgi:hypothetical protein